SAVSAAPAVLQSFPTRRSSDLLANMKVDSIESQHVQIEAMKLAFSDLYRYVSDPRSMDVTPEQMLSDAYLQSRAKLIRLDRATQDRKSTRLNSSHVKISYAVFC